MSSLGAVRAWLLSARQQHSEPDQDRGYPSGKQPCHQSRQAYVVKPRPIGHLVLDDRVRGRKANANKDEAKDGDAASDPVGAHIRLDVPNRLGETSKTSYSHSIVPGGFDVMS